MINMENSKVLTDKYTLTNWEVKPVRPLPKPKVNNVETIVETERFLEALKAYNRSKLIYKDYIDLKRLEQKRRTQLFKDDLKDYVGVKDNPKADRMIDLAWDYGHSAGLLEVVNYALELSEIMN
jgi:hypothetical protein